MTDSASQPAVSVLYTKAELNRSTKLAEYIREAREELIPSEVPWAASYWPGFGTFTNLQSTGPGRHRRGQPPAQLLDKEFIEFSRAYLVQCRSANPSETNSQCAVRLTALRLIEAALQNVHGSANPLRIDRKVLDRAATLARSRFAVGTTQNIGPALQKVGRVLHSEGILPLDVKSWEHPFPTAKGRLAVGGDGDAIRAARLPNPAAIDALAEIFNTKLDPSDERHARDIFTTGVTALLFAAPTRGNQIVRLPVQSLHREYDSNGKERTALRVDASKGFEPHAKWIIKDMVPAVETAIGRVTAITEEARRLARHFEMPMTRGKFFRHSNCPDVAEDEPLTARQACEALGLTTTDAADALAKAGLARRTFGTYTLSKLWHNWVLPELRKRCPHFPYVSARDKARGRKGGLKYSEALFCMRANQLHAANATSCVLPWMPTLSSYMQDVGFRPADARRRTIFDRYNYIDARGEVLGFTSHQARHLLNTEAQRSSLPDDLIARWSGRKNISQNMVYDQRPTQERVEHARSIVTATAAETDNKSVAVAARRHGPWLIAVPHQLRSCGDLEDIEPQLTGLQTQFGECYHDYASSPCEGFVGCLECNEHDCIKSSSQDAMDRLVRIERLRQHAVAEVEKSQGAVAAGDWGAQDWLGVQKTWVRKLDELIAILRDPAVPEGARVRLSGANRPTHLHRTLRGIATQALQNGDAPDDVIEQMLRAIEQKTPLATGYIVQPDVDRDPGIGKKE
jgi:hypothetical protein